MIDNSPIRIYVKKIESRITFKIKTEHYVELLIPETIKLLRNIEKKIIKMKNVRHLEIIEVLLVHCNIVSNEYQHDSRVLYIFVLDKSFGQ